MINLNPHQLLSLDLAGSPKHNTGYAYLRKNSATLITGTLLEDSDILCLAKKPRFKLIGIDAPLSLPPGRKTIEDRGGAHFRPCDLMLRSMGIRFFPITLGPMRMLTRRGMEIKQSLENNQKTVIELFPGASLDILGIPRKDPKAVAAFLAKQGWRVKQMESVDESDAAIGLYTLYLFTKQRAKLLGNQILIPSKTPHL